VEELLGRVQGDLDAQPILEQIIDLIAQVSECESVGIRWKAGEDYPYFVTRGFGREFIVREGPLCARDAAGLILRHPDGSAQLACMCGAVAQGNVNPRLPIFTHGGSFWTNGTTGLLREAPPSDSAKIKTRNYCNEAGYESVALIPLRAGDETMGILQLNSRMSGRFTAELIEEYETLARRIGEAVARVMREQLGQV
jgi:GAF domain-containing protein